MIFPLLDKLRISPDIIRNLRLIIFNAHNMFIIRRKIFEFLNCTAGFGCQNGFDPFGNVFKIAVKLRTLQNLDYIDLPLFIFQHEPDVKLQTGFFIISKVAIFHTGNGGSGDTKLIANHRDIIDY